MASSAQAQSTLRPNAQKSKPRTQARERVTCRRTSESPVLEASRASELTFTDTQTTNVGMNGNDTKQNGIIVTLRCKQKRQRGLGQCSPTARSDSLRP